MDLFEKLPWRITEPSVLDVGTNFLKEETVSQSYVFLDNFVPSEPEEEPEPEKSEPKKPKKTENEQKTNKNTDKKENKILKGYKQTSRLNETEHQQCLQALQLLESGRPLSSFSLKEQQVINIYNNLRSVIHEENVEFLKFVETKWKQTVSNNTRFCSQLLHSFALAKRLQKMESIKNHPQFYANHNMVPLTKNQHEIETIHEACLLELGLIASIQIPDVEKNTSMYVNKLPPLKAVDLEDYLETTKNSVSEDIHAEFLANQTACNIVISSSSLKTIIDNFGPDFSASWDIPITVKEHEINGHKFNVVYVDKTLPQRNISMTDLNYFVRKVLLKRTMCKNFETNSFTPPPVIIENFNAKKYGTFNTFDEIPETQSNTNTDILKNNLPNTETKDDTKTTESECSTPKKPKLNPEIESPMETNDDNIKTNDDNTKTNDDHAKTNEDNTKTNDDNTKSNEDNTKTNELSTPKTRKNNNSDIKSPETNDNIKTNEDNTKTKEFSTPKRRKNNLNIQSPVTNEFETPKKQNKSQIISPIKSPSIILTRSASRKLQETNNSESSETESSSKNSSQIMKQETESATNDETKQNLRKKGKRNKCSSYHNVNYRLWKLKVKDEENVLMKNCAEKKEIKVIVRSKIDGFQEGPNEQKTPTSIVPKLEFQPEHGGQVLTKSELLRQWTTLYFRPFSNLIRARLNTKSNKYIKIENVNLNKITNECIKHNFIPKDSVGLLFNVLSNLTNLQPGKYLLHHTPKHGPFAALLKSVPENSPSEINLYELYKNENCSIGNSKKWIPIDTTLILPNHVKNGIMPGMFPPQKSGNKGKFTQNKRQNRKPKDWDAPTDE